MLELCGLPPARRFMPPGGLLVLGDQPCLGKVRGQILLAHTVCPLAEAMSAQAPGVDLAVNKREANSGSVADFFDGEQCGRHRGVLGASALLSRLVVCRIGFPIAPGLHQPPEIRLAQEALQRPVCEFHLYAFLLRSAP